METILKITEISEMIFFLLDDKSVASMRLVNHASKIIVDNPSFWLRKLSEKYRLKFYNQVKIARWIELLNHSLKMILIWCNTKSACYKNALA